MFQQFLLLTLPFHFLKVDLKSTWGLLLYRIRSRESTVCFLQSFSDAVLKVVCSSSVVCGTQSHTRLPCPGSVSRTPLLSVYIYLPLPAQELLMALTYVIISFCLISCTLSFYSYFSNLTATWGFLFLYINLRLYLLSSTNILPIASHCNNLDTQLP